jgi:hypothetical protein
MYACANGVFLAKSNILEPQHFTIGQQNIPTFQFAREKRIRSSWQHA